MPPKAKFTREEIIKAAVRIVETDGAEALTARNLGAKLGSSARPVFTVFENMSEVFTEVDAYARGVYAGYVNAGLEEALPFKGVGENYIRFAAERPKLFALLFMKEKERIPDAHCVLEDIEDSYEKIPFRTATGLTKQPPKSCTCTSGFTRTASPCFSQRRFAPLRNGKFPKC